MTELSRLSGEAKDMQLATAWRYISVALVRGSPLAGVTRYPCPVEPGLSSRTGFRPVPAAVWPAHAAYCKSYFWQCQTKLRGLQNARHRSIID